LTFILAIIKSRSMKKLPEAWSTSPTTGAARHRRRTPVSSVPRSPSFLASCWSSQPCQVCTPWARGACSVHLGEVWPLVSRRKLCHGARSERAVRTLRSDVGRVLRPARSVLGRTAPTCSEQWSVRNRLSTCCAHGPSSVSVQKSFKN
jgi:hypothetical protein